MSRSPQPRLFPVWFVVSLFGAFAFILVFLMPVLSVAIDPMGNSGLAFVSIASSFCITPFVLPVAVVFAVYCCIQAYVHNHRKWELYATLSFAVVGIVSFAFRDTAMNQLQLRGYSRIFEQYDSVTPAIHRYERAFGKPPSTLDEIVPTYLTVLPDKLGQNLVFWTYEVQEEGWAISAEIPVGISGNLFFTYNSTQTYPPDATQIGRWAFTGSN